MRHSLLTRFGSFGDSDAVIIDDKRHSYEDLSQAIGEWSRYLDFHKIELGTVTALEGTSSFELCAGLLALVELGAIIVPLTPLPPQKRAEFLGIAEVELIVGVSGVTRNCDVTGRAATHELYQHLRDRSHAGLVLFSSGTSGHSKASVLDFTKVLSRYGDPKNPQRILSFLNFDHIGGINTLLHTLSQGGAVVMTRDRTPESVVATIERNRVQVLPTTPTFLNLLLMSGALDRHRVDTLGLVTYGTEPMPLQTLQRLTAALPQTRFKQTYGLSELGILPTKSRSDNTLWVKIGGNGFDYKIIDNVLWIKSDMAMLGYLNADAPFDEDGYFNTQDIVETDGDYLRILGRRSEIINVGGEKVYPAEVENVLLQVPNVAEATVMSAPSHIVGNVVKAVLQLVYDEDIELVRKRVREFCENRLEAFKVPVVIEVTDLPQHSDRFKKMRALR